jgi:hypothetical protein
MKGKHECALKKRNFVRKTEQAMLRHFDLIIFGWIGVLGQPQYNSWTHPGKPRLGNAEKEPSEDEVQLPGLRPASLRLSVCIQPGLQALLDGTLDPDKLDSHAEAGITCSY